MTAATKSTKVPGSAIAPDLKKHATSTGRQYAYWIGSLPSAPRDVAYIAGIDFPKMTEDVIGTGQSTRRIPKVGRVAWLNDEQVRRLRERLPAVVVRFQDPPQDEGYYNGTLADVTPEKPRRKGHLITIPSEEDLATAKRHKRSLRRYVFNESDEPVARHIFMQLCADQKRPSTGSVYPESVADTGIEWPDTL